MLRAAALAEVGALDAPHSDHTHDFNLFLRLAARYDIAFPGSALSLVRIHPEQDTETNFRAAAATGSLALATELVDAAAYMCPWRSQWFGLPDRRREEVLASADLLINVSGTLERPEAYRHIPRLAYIDSDPVFTQVRLAMDPGPFPALIDRHDVHFSFGETLAQADVTDNGHTWRPTHQPVVLAQWPVRVPARDVFTTVMSWTSYAALGFEGRSSGQKDVELMKFVDLAGMVAPNVLEFAINEGMTDQSFPEYLDLPRRVGPTLEIALGSPNAPRTELTERGWALRDPRAVSEDPWTYQDYIQRSKAEFSLAKHGYVVSASGWFSERSACYLATGRPVVLQDCAFSQWLPTGEGVLAFDTPQQAIACIEAVEGAYEFHCRKAREVAEASFDARAVLASLIERAMQPSDRAAPAS